MKIFTILMALIVAVMGCYFVDLGGNALTVFGFSMTFLASLVLVDELAN